MCIRMRLKGDYSSLRILANAALLVVIMFAAACTRQLAPRSSALRLIARAAPSMGSELRVSVWAADEKSVENAFEAIVTEFDRLEDVMSNWREDSEVQRINAAAGKHPVPVSSEMRDVFRSARQISEWTEGKFDVTFGVLSGLWKFDYQNKDGSIPNHAEVERRRKFIDYRQLVVDEQAGTAFLRREGMVVHLGGIGKGFAVDRARDILGKRGFHNYMIQFGGDMYVAGLSGERPWRLGIQDPRGPADQSFASVDLSDSTFSTSGDYERYFIKDGRRYHHIIDPATGEPAMGCRSVTIMAKSATVADGLSTGVFILGPEAGMALIERLPDVEGVIVGANNQVLISSGLKSRINLLAAPGDAP